MYLSPIGDFYSKNWHADIVKNIFDVVILLGKTPPASTYYLIILESHFAEKIWLEKCITSCRNKLF